MTWAKRAMLSSVLGGRGAKEVEILPDRGLLDAVEGARGRGAVPCVHALGDAEEGILVDAAGLGIAFDVPLLAEITGVPRLTTGTLIDRAVAAGVLRTVDKGTFTFVHELCRRVLLDHLDEAGRGAAPRTDRVGVSNVATCHPRFSPCIGVSCPATRPARARGTSISWPKTRCSTPRSDGRRGRLRHVRARAGRLHDADRDRVRREHRAFHERAELMARPMLPSRTSSNAVTRPKNMPDTNGQMIRPDAMRRRRRNRVAV